ncbi:hypothetical protein SAMN02745150_00480 [Brevinema andersonii]|uniref:UPF0235 protein SAMN02745150_00480 n=1 Tax=Brevinema andersonii TaxID=34097 RepID=A0A1I1DB68_BREAD|nr:DUF167 domain-containing protein [Brevinema andersonii]SFB72195.1 hypothetical protein SAMN02745150_00480 [Brevinema andersonii]
MKLELTVVPKSSRTVLIRENQGLKLKITASPVDGQANKAVIDYFSNLLSCPKKSIHIVSGLKSKRKILIFDIPDKKDICSKIKNALRE